MAVIRPFAAIRPRREKAARVAALPYDVYNREEAAKLVEQNQESFLKIDRAETQFPPDADMYGDAVYAKAREMLLGMMEDGTFVREDAPCYYLYELTMDGRTQTGIVACASVDDYLNCVIKKHENTRAEKELDRIRHVDACDAQTGPVFLAYRKNVALKAIVEREKRKEPEYDFTAEDGVRHRVFVIDQEETIRQITGLFAGIESLYIADGHHRAAAAVKVAQRRGAEHEESMYFLAVLFPDDELMIMDYNRVVRDLNGHSTESFYEEVAKRFDVTELAEQQGKRPAQRGMFSMYLDGRWYACRIREEDVSTADPVARLDVSILQERLLNPVLGILDPKTDGRIDFVGGIRGMEELERRCQTDCAAAFAMYPTGIDELFAVADAGLLMPPKSTWFEPKLRSGLFIHSIGDGEK